MGLLMVPKRDAADQSNGQMCAQLRRLLEPGAVAFEQLECCMQCIDANSSCQVAAYSSAVRSTRIECRMPFCTPDQ